MTKLHYALYAVLFTIVALFAGWQGGTALAARQHSSRMDDAAALTTLLAEVADRRQGHMVDSVTRIDRVTAEADVLASCAKVFAAESATRAADYAMQIFGGHGYLKGGPVERLYRNAKLGELIDGTSEIHRTVIARSVMKKGAALHDLHR